MALVAKKIETLEDKYLPLIKEAFDLRALTTFVPNKKRPIHNWFPYTQGFSADLIEYLLKKLKIGKKGFVVDPFCGVGTTPLVCVQHGISSIGFDISPIAVFLADAKINRSYVVKTELLKKEIEGICKSPFKEPSEESLSVTLAKLPLLRHAYSLDRVKELLFFREEIKRRRELDQDIYQFLKTGLMAILEEVSNVRKHGAHYRFINNNNVGVKTLVDPSLFNVRQCLRLKLYKMLSDIQKHPIPGEVDVSVHQGDARMLSQELSRKVGIRKGRCTAIITSPPYLNRDNYIAQHKIELFFMEFGDWEAYRRLTATTLRSHVEARSIPEFLCKDLPEVAALVKQVEENGVNYKGIPEMILGYFQDMECVLREISSALKPGGAATLVVGNVRWAGVVIPVDLLLIRLGEKHGLVGEEIIITRYKNNSPQQMKRYGKIPVRESIVILRKD